MREPEALWWLTPRSRGVNTRCKQNAREVPPFVALLARRTRCAELVRGGASPAETTARTFTRAGPVHARHASSEVRPARLVSPCRPRKGANEGEGGERFVTSPGRTRNRLRSRLVPVHRRIAEVGRTSSGSEKRATSWRTGRKPARHSGAREREPDHRRSLRRASAGAHQWQKGDESSELGDPHHVSAASSLKAARFRSCFGASGMRVASVGGRHPGSAKRTPFTRPPRNRSWRPPSRHLDSKKSETRRTTRRRRQGCQRRSGFDFTRRKKTPPREYRPVAEVGIAP